jgi:transcriptional regulator GlxA family with amidase domain
MDAVFVLYDQMTALDLVGPYEVLASHPSVTPYFAAVAPGLVRCDNGLTLHAGTALRDVPAPDLIVVPGSGRWLAVLEDSAELTGWLAAAGRAAAWTVSVCTGSTLLAAAGLLTGRPATTHWAARETLAAGGAVVTAGRVIRDGNVMTSSGVSAGIDLALTLAAELWGAGTAQALQLGIEYDPEPPFDCGTPEKAPPALVAAVRAALPGR